MRITTVLAYCFFSVLGVLFPVIITGCGGGGGGGSGGALNPQVIDTVNASAGDIAAAIAADDTIHVCYYDANNSLKYATNASGAWATTTIQADNITSTLDGNCDIAVDGSGHAYVVYCTSSVAFGGEGDVWYATNASGAWIAAKAVINATQSFSGCGIAVESDGTAHIAYGDPGFQVGYINNSIGSWSAPVSLGSYWANVRPRLAFDSVGNLYVVYEHGGEGTLHMQLINSSGGLVSNTILDGVASTTSTGWDPAIAIDQTGDLIYVSYWDYDITSLKFYSIAGPVTIDACTWTASAVTVTPDGFVHIVFTNGALHELRHATNSSGAWVVDTLTPSSYAPDTAVVSDTAGAVYAIYAAYPGGALSLYAIPD